QRNNNAHTYYIKSRLIYSEEAELNVYANYRRILHKQKDLPTENTFNSRVQYRQSLWNNSIHLNTSLESNTGLLAQQEYTYIIIEIRKNNNKLMEYNSNGTQEFDENEIAELTNKAEYINTLCNFKFIQLLNPIAIIILPFIDALSWFNFDVSVLLLDEF